MSVEIADLDELRSHGVEIHGGQGFVRLVQHSTNMDAMIVKAARVSFANVSEPTPEEIRGLTVFLAGNGHGSPWEHTFVTFHVRTFLATSLEHMRHRIGWSYNMVSGRYRKMDRAFYVAPKEAVRVQTGKPGHYTFTTVQGDAQAEHFQSVVAEAMDSSFDTYEALVEQGYAKEIARIVLPQGTMTEWYASCNLRSLAHLLSLRTHPQAMLEIQEIAHAYEAYWKLLAPISHSAWDGAGRKAL